MSSKKIVLPLCSLLVLLSSFSKCFSSEDISMVTDRATLTSNATAGQAAVYWGQDVREGSLISTCSTGNYAFVIISYLYKYGTGVATPELNLVHCNPSRRACQRLSWEIKACQAQGVKILLSVGGPADSYSMPNSDEARNLATYIWESFLWGNNTATFRPFGSAPLDGIDFDIRGGSRMYNNGLAYAFNYGVTSGKKVYLSASVPCLSPPNPPFFDSLTHNGDKISLSLTDYIWVQFYNPDQCSYKPNNEAAYRAAWNWWTNPANTGTRAKVFFGTLADSNAGVSTRYIPPETLISKVLPFVKESPRYGGVMVWNKYYDDLNGYASAIKPHL